MSDLKLQIVLNAMGNARQKFEEITNAGSATSRKLRDLKKDIKELNSAQKTFDQFVASRQKLRGLGDELGKVQSEIKRLNSAIATSGAPTQAQAQRLDELRKRGADLRKEQKELRSNSEQLRRTLSAQNIDTKNLSNGQKQLKTQLNNTSTAIDQQKNRLLQLNKAQAVYQKTQAAASGLRSAATSAAIKGTATMAALSVPVRAYAESETASTDLRVALMDKTGQVIPEYKQIDQLATRLGDKLPGTTADFKNLMTMLVRQGLSVKSILGGTGEAAALLSVQLKQTPEAAAEMAAKLQDAIRGSESEMVNIMDSVQRLFYAGVDAPNIVPAFSKLAPALDIMKIKGAQAMQQLSPLIGMLDQAGLSGESAGNALRKVFTRAMDTEKINKATKGTGVDLNFTNGQGEFGGMEKMYTELAKLQQVNTEKRLAILGDIFGDDAETLQALNTMIEKGQAGYDEFKAKMEQQASLNQRVEEQLGTLTNLWDAASGTFTNFMASMGEAIAPELKSLTKWIAEISEKMSLWAAKNPDLANKIMKTIAAVGALLLAFAAIAGVIASVLVPFAFLRFALVQVGPLFGGASAGILKLTPCLNLLKSGILAVGRAFLANPILAVVALILGALYLLWKHWDTVKAALVAGWNWLNQVFADNPILNFIFPIIGLVRLIVNNWSVIAPFFQNLWSKVTALTSRAWSVIKMSAVAAWNGLINWIKSSSIYQTIVMQWNKITAYLSGLHKTMYDIGAKIVRGIIDGISDMVAPLKAKWNTITSVFSGNYKAAQTGSALASVGAKMPGFASGGYTGSGGRHDVAGIVHRGEGVLNQSEIRAIGGESGFNRLRSVISAGKRLLFPNAQSAAPSLTSKIGDITAMLKSKVTRPGLLEQGLAMLSGQGLSQPKPKLGGAMGFDAAMQVAGGGAAAAGFDNIKIDIHINGGHQSPIDIAKEVKRQLAEWLASQRRQGQTSFRDKD